MWYNGRGASHKVGKVEVAGSNHQLRSITSYVNGIRKKKKCNQRYQLFIQVLFLILKNVVATGKKNPSLKGGSLATHK